MSCVTNRVTFPEDITLLRWEFMLVGSRTRGSFASNQIFRDEQKKVSLLFSGECFLDSETYAFLGRRGHAINSGVGNWLIPLYLERGDGFFEQLNGLFSGLLIDHGRRRAFLFNDRYGMERLYWHENDDAFYFASEAKALLRILPELREFDKEGIIDYLRFGCTIHSRTLFKGIEIAAARFALVLRGRTVQAKQVL